MEEILEMTKGYWNEENTEKYEEAMQLLISRINEFDAAYFEKTGNHFIRFIEKRLKSPESIANKLKRKGKKLEDAQLEDLINDLAGVRVICFDTNQIYKVARMIGECKEFEILKVKDYIFHPKENGYQSYHIVLKIHSVKVELQIRTILMDAWSSLDSILIYKKSSPISEQLKKDIMRFSKWSRKMDKTVQRMMSRKVEMNEKKNK